MTAAQKIPCPLCGKTVTPYRQVDAVSFRQHHDPATGQSCAASTRRWNLEEPTLIAQAIRAALEGDRHAPLSKPAVGQPSKLTRAILEDIVGHLENGNFQDTAARLAGISETSFHNWKARGQDGLRALEAGQTLEDAEVPFLEFLVAVDHARAKAEDHFLGTIRQSAEGTQVKSVWYQDDGTEVTEFHRASDRAASWFLERSYPEKWGRIRAEISGPDGGPISMEVAVTAREHLKDKLDAMEERIKGGPEAA